MAFSESTYYALPICLQNVACSFVGWRINRKRYGPSFMRYLREACERGQWSADRVIAYQNERLAEFIQHSVKTVPYYRDLFETLKIDPREIRSRDDLRCLPILTKRDVQENGEQMLSDAISQKQRVMAHTSGTTGSGLQFATTHDSIGQQWATWWRYRGWHGLKLGQWCGYFGGRSVVPLAQESPPFWRYNIPARQILFSGYHMSVENMSYYVAQLNRRRPPWLHGYPSLLAMLASHILDTQTDLGYQVRWITTGAENLLAQQSQVIEKAFGVCPREHYGTAEAVANISECENGKLHVDEDFSAVEFVPNEDGPGYRIVGTNFTNPATPLIRYDASDVCELSDEPCSCGRTGRIVRDIDGRLEDYVVLKNGSRVGRMDHIFKDIANIREAQIYQECVGEITIHIVRGTGYSQADEDFLLRETKQRVGEDTAIGINYVDAVPRTATGKLRFVVSHLQEGQLASLGRQCDTDRRDRPAG